MDWSFLSLSGFFRGALTIRALKFLSCLLFSVLLGSTTRKWLFLFVFWFFTIFWSFLVELLHAYDIRHIRRPSFSVSFLMETTLLVTIRMYSLFWYFSAPRDARITSSWTLATSFLSHFLKQLQSLLFFLFFMNLGVVLATMPLADKLLDLQADLGLFLVGDLQKRMNLLRCLAFLGRSDCKTIDKTQNWVVRFGSFRFWAEVLVDKASPVVLGVLFGHI